MFDNIDLKAKDCVLFLASNDNANSEDANAIFEEYIKESTTKLSNLVYEQRMNGYITEEQKNAALDSINNYDPSYFEESCPCSSGPSQYLLDSIHDISDAFNNYITEGVVGFYNHIL